MGEPLTPEQVIARIAQVADSFSFSAGVGGMETAGQIVSVLAKHPHLTDRFLAQGVGFMIDEPLARPVPRRNPPLAHDVDTHQFRALSDKPGQFPRLKDAIVPSRIVADDERSPLPFEFNGDVIHGAHPRETHRGALVRP